MSKDVMRLLDEYVVRLARGDRPDLAEYLARAGDERDELGRLVDAWLQRFEPPQPDEESVQLARAWLAGEPPLLTLRVRRGLRRSDLVDRIVERFSLDPAKRQKVERYVHEVETGQLRPSPRIREAVEVILGRRALSWRAMPPPASKPAYFRGKQLPEEPEPAPASLEPWDEIDELFRGDRLP